MPSRHPAGPARRPTSMALVAAALTLASATAALTLTVPTGPVGAAPPTQGRVGPNQQFVASVNGGNGVPTPATIRMACFGPVTPSSTGHPMAGQYVEVYRPEVIVADLGFTGPTARTIQAFFGAPPPSPVTPGTVSAGADVAFTRYAVRKAIPTSLTLPCSGSGDVYFVPLPGTPLGPARDAVVRVDYVGQP